jgi:hypothetical protein
MAPAGKVLANARKITPVLALSLSFFDSSASMVLVLFVLGIFTATSSLEFFPSQPSASSSSVGARSQNKTKHNP